ncbi:hypothetical protein ACOMHN_060789 [Nucella lapillus]
MKADNMDTAGDEKAKDMDTAGPHESGQTPAPSTKAWRSSLADQLKCSAAPCLGCTLASKRRRRQNHHAPPLLPLCHDSDIGGCPPQL